MKLSLTFGRPDATVCYKSLFKRLKGEIELTQHQIIRHGSGEPSLFARCLKISSVCTMPHAVKTNSSLVRGSQSHGPPDGCGTEKNYGGDF